MAVPRQRAPLAARRNGLAERGHTPVDPATHATPFPGLDALGDVAAQGTPEAGSFAEGAAGVLTSALIRELSGDGEPLPHFGRGSCCVTFGAGRIARVDIDLPPATGPPAPTSRRPRRSGS